MQQKELSLNSWAKERKANHKAFIYDSDTREELGRNFRSQHQKFRKVLAKKYGEKTNYISVIVFLHIPGVWTLKQQAVL